MMGKMLQEKEKRINTLLCFSSGKISAMQKKWQQCSPREGKDAEHKKKYI